MRTAATLPSEPTVDLIQPDLAQRLGPDLQKETQALVVRFSEIAVIDRSSCQQAVLDRQEIGDRMKRVEAFFEPFKSMAFKLHKAICSREGEILAPLKALDTRLRDGIQAFTAAEDRKRRDEEQRLAEERRREEEVHQLAEAAQLEAAGDTELAAAVIEQAIAAPAPVVNLPDVRRQVDGLKTRTEWKWRYTGNSVERAMQLIPREYLCIDEKKVGAYVRAMKGTAKIPGIEVYSEQVPVR
jgi:hypothetical protein